MARSASSLPARHCRAFGGWHIFFMVGIDLVWNLSIDDLSKSEQQEEEAKKPAVFDSTVNTEDRGYPASIGLFSSGSTNLRHA